VLEGTLAISAASAISSNSTYRLVTGSPLALNYVGTAPVKGLYTNGVALPPGVYGSSTPPITGSGTLTVLLPQTWNNGSGNFLWDLTSANWSFSPWTDGGDATFGATGVGTILLDSPITVHNQTFNTTGYSIVASNGNVMTLAGAGNPTITVNAAYATNSASLYGTNGLTVQGTGTLVLKGDPGNITGNHYTGGTYVRGGTVVLAADYANVSGTSCAIDSIEALDYGATVMFGTTFNGTSFVSPPLHQVASHAVGSKLHMTGGTFDLNNEPRNQHLPMPEGTGLIINTGTNVQSGLIIYADGQNHTFNGVIADGGPLVGDNSPTGPTPQGPGRQIGILNIAAGTSGGVLTLTASNTYSGSTRLQFGSIRLSGNGTIGFPTPNALTGPLRVYGPSFLDLHGCNQTLALMTGGDTGGKIFNSATGTVSTLTFGYGNEQASRNANMQYIDNGGILAMKKIGNNCAQTLSGVNTYSGDTTVAEGTLILSTVSAVSSNSAYRLNTTLGANALLRLTYVGTAPVRQLWINGVQQANGVYGSGTPGIDATSTGTITVTGFAPASLGVVQSGNTLNFSWAGVYKLQAKTNNIIGPWFDYPGGGSSPVSVPMNPAIGSVYFRLSTY
jgi:fibronectin-binding autotransporter adhesin